MTRRRQTITRKTIAAVVVLGLMAVPAMADLAPSMYTPTLAPAMSPTGEGTVGVYGYDTVYGPTIYYDFTLPPVPMYPSEIITVTFAFHWPYSTPVWGIQCWGGFVYDNYEMAVLSMVPAGPFVGGNNNFPSSATWQSGNDDTRESFSKNGSLENMASVMVRMFRWESMAPFGGPVVPDV